MNFDTFQAAIQGSMPPPPPWPSANIPIDPTLPIDPALSTLPIDLASLPSIARGALIPLSQKPRRASGPRGSYGLRLTRLQETKLCIIATREWPMRGNYSNKKAWWKEVEKEFSENYLGPGQLYKSANNRLNTMRKRFEGEDVDESGTGPVDDDWIQAVQVWIEMQDAEQAEKADRAQQMKKKQAEVYMSYQVRRDLALNHSQKQLTDLADFEEDEEGYSTEDRDKSTGDDEDDDVLEWNLGGANERLSAVSRSPSGSRSSSARGRRRKTQADRLPRAEVGKRRRKPRVNEMEARLAKLDSYMEGLGTLMTAEAIGSMTAIERRLDGVEKKQEEIGNQLRTIIDLLRHGRHN